MAHHKIFTHYIKHSFYRGPFHEGRESVLCRIKACIIKLIFILIQQLQYEEKLKDLQCLTENIAFHHSVKEIHKNYYGLKLI